MILAILTNVQYNSRHQCANNCALLLVRQKRENQWILVIFAEIVLVSAGYGEAKIQQADFAVVVPFLNREISRVPVGQMLGTASLRDLLIRLRDQGVHNINLVTPTHYARVITEALTGLELGIPVVWNSSGYESVETLRRLEGLVQIYMPDYKYADPEIARRYSTAPDYPCVAAAAISEMFRQTGPFVMDDNGLLKSGVLIRHLILPGFEENTMNVIDYVADSFPHGSVLFSLMSQYTPMQGSGCFPELQQCVSAESNELLCHYMKIRKIETGYWQDPASATGEMIPDFHHPGII